MSIRPTVPGAAPALTAALLLAAGSLRADAGRTFDVSPGGALPSPAAALDAVRAWRAAGAPDQEARIRIAAGTYALPAALHLDARDHHLVLEAAEPGQVTLSGGTPIRAWAAAGDHLWRAELPADLPVPEQLYTADARAPRAREPDGGFFVLESATQVSNRDGVAGIDLGLPTEAAALLPAPAATIQVFHKWDTTRGPVAAFDATARVARLAGGPMKP